MALSGLPSLSLRLLLLLCFLSPSCPETSTSPDPTSDPSTESPSVTPTPHNASGAGARCLIDNQMGLIAIGSAGGLIVCLLFTVITLACQVHHLRRRVYIPRSSRSNLDISGSAGYWANAAAAMERAGDTSVMMDEMKKSEGEEEEREELGEIREEEDEEEEEEEGGAGVSPEEKPLMPSSESRESDMPQSLEDMPLVV